jgi:hypothetical protein
MRLALIYQSIQEALCLDRIDSMIKLLDKEDKAALLIRNWPIKMPANV